MVLPSHSYDNDKTRRGGTYIPVIILLVVLVLVLGAVGYFGIDLSSQPAAVEIAAGGRVESRTLGAVTGGSLTGVGTKSPVVHAMDDLDRLHDALLERTALSRDSKLLSRKAQLELAQVKEKLDSARRALRAQMEASKEFEVKATGAEGIIAGLREKLRDCATKLVERAARSLEDKANNEAAAVASPGEVHVAHLEPDSETDSGEDGVGGVAEVGVEVAEVVEVVEVVVTEVAVVGEALVVAVGSSKLQEAEVVLGEAGVG